MLRMKESDTVKGPTKLQLYESSPVVRAVTAAVVNTDLSTVIQTIMSETDQHPAQNTERAAVEWLMSIDGIIESLSEATNIVRSLTRVGLKTALLNQIIYPDGTVSDTVFKLTTIELNTRIKKHVGK